MTFRRGTIYFILSLIILIEVANALLGNLVATFFQEKLGANLGVVLVPFAVLVAILFGFEQSNRLREYTTKETRAEPSDDRNRAKMLDKVENFWIKGVLEQSLYQIARLELGLEQAPEKIDHPWQTLLQQAATSRVVPTGTPVIKLFDDLDGTLLILGAPGAGKTTLLLELTCDLIARARSDPQHPIPLVFNLSTWASKRQPLKEWLAEELNQRYDAPVKLAQAWMDADVVLPLLDGLDEVAAALRGDCVEAINTYRQEHGLVSLTVCSRVADYEALATKLRLQGAIVVQPLTDQQVDTYLERASEKLAGVRAALHNDTDLRELLDTPLMLSVVTLAYTGTAETEVQAVGTPDEWRRHLFDAYIQAMFNRRGKEVQYTQQQTKHWLSWLAGKLVEHSETVFYIERMQPDWLPQRQRGGHAISVGLIFGLTFGLIGG